MKSALSILFLGKADDPYTARALEYCRTNFDVVEAHLGRWGDKLPSAVKEWRGDLVVSFLSRWIVPDSVLRSAKLDAINFHPGPPEYPGIGCNNFALYDQAKEYGTTCHRMAPKVDTGDIIAVKRIPVQDNDSVRSLLDRCYEAQLSLFFDVMGQLKQGHKLTASNETWARKPYTRDEFNALCRLTPDMPKDEMLRRIRATTFGPWLPSLEINGIEFTLSPQTAKSMGLL